MLKHLFCITSNICIVVIIFFLFSCDNKPNTKYNQKKSRIQVLSEDINQNSHDLSLLLERANYYKNRDNWNLMLFDAKQCLSIDSMNVEANLLAGKAYFEISKTNYKKTSYPYLALRYLSRAIKYDAKNIEGLLLNARVLIAFSKFNEAIHCINQALTINYNLDEGHLLLGYIFKSLDKEQEAINCFNNAVQVNPEFTEGYIQLARIYAARDDTLAISYYNNALKINPEDLNILYAKGVFFQSRKDWNLALKAYSDVHKIDPFHADAHYNLGFIHMELNLLNIATNNFSDAIYTESNYYQAYYSRGFCFEKLGNIAQAERDYTRAIEINPKYTFAMDALNQLKQNNKKIKN